MPKNGFVVSDLHLLSASGDEPRAMAIIDREAQDAEVCVLNGDIFELRWSTHPLPETIDLAVAWLMNFLHRYPQCTLYYVIGNHDAAVELADRLADIVHPRFVWSTTHIVLGDKLFTHGDRLLGRGDPFARVLRPNMRIASRVLHRAYLSVITRCVHRIFDFFSPTPRCVKRMHARLQRHAPELLAGIREIYTGHTHVPCEAVRLGNVAFFNTGSAMHGSAMQPFRFHA